MFADVNGARICYDVHGEGEPVVLVEGFGANRKFWNNLLPLMDGYMCITLDNRGFGDTEYEGSFTIDDMADDIIALMDHLGIGRFHAIGWSMGSLILQSMSLRYPDRMTSQVLISTYKDRPARSSYILGEFTRMVNEGTATMDSFYVAINAFCFSEGVFRSMEDAGMVMPIPRKKADPKGFLNQMSAVADFYPGDGLSAIRVPTMVVQGKEDIMTPFHHGEVVSRLIEGSELYPVEGQGHTIPPELYVKKVLSFLKEHSDL